MPNRFTLYQIDAFAEELFRGNPAAIVPLDEWLPDELMQKVATENNLSETAFFIPAANEAARNEAARNEAARNEAAQKEAAQKETNRNAARADAANSEFELRWFTPVAEVDLCGHATLAAAFVVFTELAKKLNTVRFNSRRGPLTVRRLSEQHGERRGERLCMDFPAITTDPIGPPEGMADALGCEIKTIGIAHGLDYVVEVESESIVRNLAPDFHALRAFDQARGIIVTAAGDSCDFVSRFFAPNFGVDEDPVTGSAHCALAPFWAKRLSKTILKARQLSRRSGNIECHVSNDRVQLMGHAVKYLEGQIQTA